MKKNACYLYLFLNILLTSCANNSNSPIKHFAGKPVEKIYPSKIVDLEEFGVLRPFHFIQIDDSIFVIQDLKNENIFNLINLSSKKVIRGVSKGQGPAEVLTPSVLQYRNNKILIYDAYPKKRMYELIVSSDSTLVIKEAYRIDTDVVIITVVNQLDTTFIATGMFEEFWLAEMNQDGKIFSTIEFPEWEETRNVAKTAHSSLYGMTLMANSPDNKRVAVTRGNQGIISFLNRTESGIKEYKQIKYHAPQFRVEARGSIAYSRDNVEGFQDIACDDNYVYAIYSGRTFNSHQMLYYHCEHLMVYDWEGNPVKRYILDIPLHRMTYNKERNRIYGLGENPEGVLVEYQL